MRRRRRERAGQFPICLLIRRQESWSTSAAGGDLPLVVITRGLPDETGPNAAAMEEEHRKDHAAVAALSRRGQLVFAAHSAHHVQLQQPELVVNIIQQVVAATRK